jgi:hypothetical protein
MEKEKAMLNTNIDPEIFRKFKMALIQKNITVSDWAEQKITEEANTINIEVK